MVSENHHFSNGSAEESAVVVVGADSSIGKALVPELLLKYKRLILRNGKKDKDFLSNSKD